MNEIERFGAQLEEIERLIGGGDAALEVRQLAVSSWSVGQQVDHLLRVAHGVVNRLSADGEALPRGINWTGRLLLALRWLPRGVGKAPERARPAESPAAAELTSRLPELRAALSGLAARADLATHRKPLVKHPYFRGLTPTQALRFLTVHTDHHLKIVRDIQRAQQP